MQTANRILRVFSIIMKIWWHKDELHGNFCFEAPMAKIWMEDVFRV